MRFVLNHLAGVPEIATLPGFEDADPDLVAHIESGNQVFGPSPVTGHIWRTFRRGPKRKFLTQLLASPSHPNTQRHLCKTASSYLFPTRTDGSSPISRCSLTL
jgi:hypothetical protein